jgi:hypothetical protein
MDQLLFTVITFGTALLGFALLAWVGRNEHESHAQHPNSGQHPVRRD